MKITLASASPRRRELIKRLGADVDIVPALVDENETARDPETLVKLLALKKAREVFSRVGGVVIGADTVVAADGIILGKPPTEKEAKQYLRLLSGRTHEVLTGVAVVSKDKEVVEAEVTRVTFGEYDEKIVDEYVKSGSPLDKAGAYGAQDELIRPMIVSVDGDEDNVIGLPVARLQKILEERFQWRQWT